MDIHLVIDISSDQAEAFQQTFAPNYYVDLTAVKRAVREHSMFNLISNVNGVKIDCIVRNNIAFERLKFERRRHVDLEGIGFWVASKEDLILSKLQWARCSHSQMQFRDIVRLAVSGYDHKYVANWINREDLNETWTKVEEWKIQAEK